MNGYCLLALGSNVEGENKSHDPQDQIRGNSSQAIFSQKGSLDVFFGHRHARAR